MLFLPSRPFLLKGAVIVNKHVAALMAAVAFAVPAISAAQQADAGKMMQMFSQSVRTDGGNLQIVLLNDRTVDAIFGTSPAKAAFKTKARMTTVFFVQATVNKEFEFNPELTVVQKGETLQGKATGMKNFAAGKVAKGELIQGLVELPKAVDLYEPFKVTISGETAEFRLNRDDVRDYGNR